MTTVHLTLPDDLAAFLADQTTRDGFGSTDEYLRALIQAERTRQARRQLEAKLQEALDSGPARPLTPEDWTDLRRQALDGLDGETIRR